MRCSFAKPQRSVLWAKRFLFSCDFSIADFWKSVNRIFDFFGKIFLRPLLRKIKQQNDQAKDAKTPCDDGKELEDREGGFARDLSGFSIDEELVKLIAVLIRRDPDGQKEMLEAHAVVAVVILHPAVGVKAAPPFNMRDHFLMHAGEE